MPSQADIDRRPLCVGGPIARANLEELGARTMDCRGFYSHFLRVWYPADAKQSLATVDFTDAGGLPKRKIDALVRRISRMKSKEV